MKYTALLVLILAATPVFAQHHEDSHDPADSAAIRATALDYIEGFYEGNLERMERAVHPDLAKRIVNTRDGKSVVSNMTAERLLEITGRSGTANTPVDERRADVRITDIYGHSATARIDAFRWVDFLQLSKIDGQWVIINVLWEMYPEGK